MPSEEAKHMAVCLLTGAVLGNHPVEVPNVYDAVDRALSLAKQQNPYADGDDLHLMTAALLASGIARWRARYQLDTDEEGLSRAQDLERYLELKCQEVDAAQEQAYRDHEAELLVVEPPRVYGEFAGDRPDPPPPAYSGEHGAPETPPDPPVEVAP